MAASIRPDSGKEALIEDDPRVNDFVSSFRNTKHFLLNTIAIWIAQAELAKRDPVFYQRLADSVLERAQTLAEMTRDSEMKLRAFARYPNLDKKKIGD